MGTVLVYRALGLGDFLTGLPALRAIRDAVPGSRVVLAAPAPLRRLLEVAVPAVDLFATRPFEPLPVWRPELAVNLHGRGPQSHAVLQATRPCRLIAFAPPVERSDGEAPEGGAAAPRDATPEDPAPGGPPWREDEHEVHRWCRLLHRSGIPADPTDLDLDREAVLRLLGDLPSGVDPWGATIIHPGAASGARRWPVERFVAVTRAEHRAGRRVLVTGGPGERRLADEIALGAGLGRDAVVAGRTDLGSLAAIVAAAARVVCGDTGVGHLATALGTPSVVLFGPTSPARWGPPPDRPAHVALWAGSVGDPHGQQPDAGLLRIEVDAVLAALERLGPAARPRTQAEAEAVGDRFDGQAAPGVRSDPRPPHDRPPSR